MTLVCVSLLQDLMEHFNPGLQKLVDLGNGYVKAFQGISDYIRSTALQKELRVCFFHPRPSLVPLSLLSFSLPIPQSGHDL